MRSWYCFTTDEVHRSGSVERQREKEGGSGTETGRAQWRRAEGRDEFAFRCAGLQMTTVCAVNTRSEKQECCPGKGRSEQCPCTGHLSPS